MQTQHFKTGILPPIIDDISRYVNIDKTSLISKGIRSFLNERKTGFLLDRLNLLSRYGVVSQEELEIGIRDGRISEHPAWEDLIAVENIESELEKINGYLENL